MKSAENTYLKRIASLVGEGNYQRALETFVSAQRAPNETLDALAYRLGVSRIIEQRLPFEGGLFRLSHDELVIRLNIDSSFARKRFTLAHEIGHLLLHTVPAFRGSRGADAALERTCDMIAAELLMPATETSSFVHGLGTPSPEKLRAVASRFGVSVQAAAIRIRDSLKLWKFSIGMWTAGPNVRTLWFIAPRKWQYEKPSLGSVERALSSNSSTSTNEWWECAQYTERVWLNLLRVGTASVLGLVDFAKDTKAQKNQAQNSRGQVRSTQGPHENDQVTATSKER